MPYSTKWKCDWQYWNKTEKIASEDYVILKAIEAEVKPWWGVIGMIQGGLESSSSYSASTHVGLGVFDLSVKNRSTGVYRSEATVMRFAEYFLRSGLVPFIRGYEIGSYDDKWDSNRHVHVVSRETYDHEHSSAQRQLREYQAWRASTSSDGDGLVSNQRFPGPRDPKLEHWSTSPYNSKNIKTDAKTYVVNVDQGSYLKGLDVDRHIKTSRERGFKVISDHQVKRWDRWNVVTEFDTYYALEYLTPAA